MRFCRNGPFALGAIVLPQVPAAFTSVSMYCPTAVGTHWQICAWAVKAPVQGSSKTQICGEAAQLFLRIACWLIAPLLWPEVRGPTTKLPSGATALYDRVGWKPAGGAGRAVPGAWWTLSQSWSSIQAACHVLWMQSKA